MILLRVMSMHSYVESVFRLAKDKNSHVCLGIVKREPASFIKASGSPDQISTFECASVCVIWLSCIEVYNLFLSMHPFVSVSSSIPTPSWEMHFCFGTKR